MTTAAAPMPDTAPLKDAVTERTVLGVSMDYGLGPQFHTEGVRASLFVSPHHQLIWQAIEDLFDAPGGATYLAVRTLLIERRQLDEVGPADLAEINMHGLRLQPEGVHTLAQRLITLAGAREAVAKLDRFKALVVANGTINESFFTALSAQLEPIRQTVAAADRRIPAHVKHVSDVLAEMRAELTRGPSTFVDFAYPTLNHYLGGGLRRDELLVIGGKPGGGKSALALETIMRAGRQGKTSFVLSREMKEIALGKRIIQQDGAVDGFKLRRGALSLLDWEALDLAIDRLKDLPIWITTERLRVSHIRQIAEAMLAEGTLDLIVIDYLQLVDVAPGVKDRRHQIEDISRELKNITIDLQVPVIALSSFNRSSGTERPTMASLRESGNIEHDANSIVLLHRPNDEEPDVTAIVAKSRDAKVGDVPLRFIGATLRFQERESDYGSRRGED